MRTRLRRGGRRRRSCLVLALAALHASGCGDDPIDTVEVDPTVAPFVGDWHATELVLTNEADPDAEPLDVLENGGSFTINVQPSGSYTAILTFPALPPGVEMGDLTVVESSLVLHPNDGSPAVSEFTFEGPDRVTLDGRTQFDFNLDGTTEDAGAHFVLERT